MVRRREVAAARLTIAAPLVSAGSDQPHWPSRGGHACRATARALPYARCRAEFLRAVISREAAVPGEQAKLCQGERDVRVSARARQFGTYARGGGGVEFQAEARDRACDRAELIGIHRLEQGAGDPHRAAVKLPFLGHAGLDRDRDAAQVLVAAHPGDHFPAITLPSRGGAYNAEQRAHGGQTVSAIGYFGTAQLWFESFRNWQREFLAIAATVVLSIFLRRQGSPESKPVAASHGETGAGQACELPRLTGADR